jgi:hypothetical protein
MLAELLKCSSRIRKHVFFGFSVDAAAEQLK